MIRVPRLTALAVLGIVVLALILATLQNGSSVPAPLAPLAVITQSLRTISLSIGQNIKFTCPGTLVWTSPTVSCIANSPTPTATPGPALTPTATVLATRTPLVTPTVTLTTTSGTTWYISKLGTNADGKSWATAWNELNQVAWGNIKPGDTLYLDGGPTSCASPFNASVIPPYDFPNPKPGQNNSCGMLYLTSLTVGASGTRAAPILIALSKDPGHNGTAVFFGGRSASLPYCQQASYSFQTSGVLDAGITISNQSFITIEGSHRSGIVIYGDNGAGVNLPNNPSFLTLRNVEIFDSGIALASPFWSTDDPGIWMTGHDLVFDRLLIHDNGQDAIQDRTLSTGQANLTVSNSWLYQSRENPLSLGWGFNQFDAEACQHVDGIQTWNGGVQNNLTLTNDLIGPYLGQGIYPSGGAAGPSWNNVAVTNVLLLPYYASLQFDGVPTTGDHFTNVTSYKAASAPDGFCCSAHVDSLLGTNHVMTDSIMQGQTNFSGDQLTGTGNDYWLTAPIAGATNVNPQFARVLTTQRPHFSDWQLVDLTATCATCAGRGSTLHTLDDILRLIDNLNGP